MRMYVLFTTLIMTIATQAVAHVNFQDLVKYRGRLTSLKQMAHDLNAHPAYVFKAALESNKVVVDFFATWCRPCQRLTPDLEKMASEWNDVLFVKVDTEQYPEIAAQYAVRSIPTLVFVRNGKMIARMTGTDKNAIKRKLREL